MKMKDLGFESISDDYYKCMKCGALIERGIANISNHWASCEGKAFKEALVELAVKNNGKVTEEQLEELHNVHIKEGPGKSENKV